MLKKLKQINFSKGIRSEDIQYNFETLENQIANDRLSTFGYGISNGLDFNIENFSLTITEGSIISTTGKLEFVEETTLAISKPKLSPKTENKIVASGGQIILKETPYDISRLTIASIDSANNSITILTNAGKIIKPRFMSDNILVVDASYAGLSVTINYYSTSKRYDTIYVDKNKEIKIIEGTTSTSPSVMYPDKEDTDLLLGYLEINPYYLDTVAGKKVAKLTLKKDLRTFKNIYTDENNVLFICGVAFNNLQIINMICPENPGENMLWYDIDNNLLKVWKTVDGISQWINVNDTTITPVAETKLWVPEKNPTDLATFIFDFDEVNMRFLPNRNELSINVDQYVLQRDQYQEVTLEDAFYNEKVYALAKQKGYSDLLMQTYNETFENIGIGFILTTPLDAPCHVEATITHRTTENPVLTRFQRTATFVKTGYYTINSTTPVITIEDSFYRYNENQLEVYLNGEYLTPTKDFIEGLEGVNDYIKGEAINQFTIKKTIPDNSIVSFKITTSVFSYDHLENFFNNIPVDPGYPEPRFLSLDIPEDSTLETNPVVGELLTAAASDEIIQEENLSAEIKSGLVKGLINETVTKTSAPFIILTNINESDYINVYNVTQNKLLLRNLNNEVIWDYLIESVEDQVIMTFKTPNTVNLNDVIYITGIKLTNQEK